MFTKVLIHHTLTRPFRMSTTPGAFGRRYFLNKYSSKQRLRATPLLVRWFWVVFGRVSHQRAFCPKKVGFVNPKAFFCEPSDAPGRRFHLYLMKREDPTPIFLINLNVGRSKKIEMSEKRFFRHFVKFKMGRLSNKSNNVP